jgi:hypothetical protein
VIDPRGPSAQAFFGGWSYAEVIHIPSTAALADISGAYPWAYGAKDLVRFDVARRINTVSVLADVRRLGAEEDLADRLLAGEVPFATRPILVEARPHGEAILPVRATWGADGRFSMSLVDFEGASSWWWLDDLLAGVALGGQFPTDVLRAIELVPVGERDGLQPVRLITGRVVDPASEDLVRAVSEERRRVGRDTWRDNETRERMAHHLRMLGTTLAFGNRARVDRERLRKSAQSAAIFGEDVVVVVAPVREVPGPHLDLIVAGSITARVRLALAVVIANVEQRGGRVLHVATDSVLVAVSHVDDSVAPAGEVLDGEPDLTRLARFTIDQIDAILRTSGAPWTWKAGHDRELVAVVSGTYKWALVDLVTSEVQCTEAMLGGVYLDPSGTGERTADGKHAWAVAAHGAVAKATIEWVRTGELPELSLPAWVELLALRGGEARTPAQLQRLQALYPERRLRPFTRYAVAVVDPLDGSDALPVTLDVDLMPDSWALARWRDLRTGASVEPRTGTLGLQGCVRCRTIREVLEAWRIPHDPSRAPLVESDQVLAPGIYQALPVVSCQALFEAIGKEGDDLLNLMVDPIADEGQAVTVYRRADTWAPVLDVARTHGAQRLHQMTGIPLRTLRRILASGRSSADHAAAIASALKDMPEIPPRVCARPGCGNGVRRRQTYCGDACRKAVARARDRLDLHARGARRCRRCRAILFGDASTPCPECLRRPAAGALTVTCSGCGAGRLGATEEPCPACGTTP